MAACCITCCATSHPPDPNGLSPGAADIRNHDRRVTQVARLFAWRSAGWAERCRTQFRDARLRAFPLMSYAAMPHVKGSQRGKDHEKPDHIRTDHRIERTCRLRRPGRQQIAPFLPVAERGGTLRNHALNRGPQSPRQPKFNNQPRLFRPCPGRTCGDQSASAFSNSGAKRFS